MISAKTTFVTLSGAAFALLLGGLVVNGTMSAMLSAILAGRFSSGEPLYRVYSAIPGVDHLEAIQVAFWQPIVTEGATRLQAILLCASLQTAGLWAAIENSRRGKKHWVLAYAPLYAFMWGACGVATLLPIFFHVELEQRARRPVQDPSLPVSKARALLPALVIALMYPYYLMLFTPEAVTASQHQNYIVFYQFSPFFCYAAIQTFAPVLSGPTSSIKFIKDGRDADVTFVKAAYALAGLWSAAAYVIVVAIALSTGQLTRIFLPNPFAVSRAAGSAAHIKEGSFLFMQIDFIIVLLASLLYAAKTLRAPPFSWTVSSAANMLHVVGLCAAGILFGPGATVSAVLFAREEPLREVWRKEVAAVGEKRGTHAMAALQCADVDD